MADYFAIGTYLQYSLLNEFIALDRKRDVTFYHTEGTLTNAELYSILWLQNKEVSMLDIFDLTGKVAIVTGGNQGIGLAISRGLGQAGATVILANRRVEEGAKAAQTLEKEGLKAVSIPTDVSEESSIAALVAKVIDSYGKIDILVNNAGVIVRKQVEEFTRQDWDHIMNTNLRGVFFCCQLVGREMMKQKKGKIINISSDASQRAMAERSVYAASKAGLSHLTRCLAVEWAPYNINVNAIGPGPTITPLNQDYFKQNPDKLQQVKQAIPLGRMGDTSDYMGAAVYLASEASNFVTGQTLLVEGGSTLP
jgi:NAD(P)-dependent dehydrogenase (short-subunit alcohol dehydrogenase family)